MHVYGLNKQHQRVCKRIGSHFTTQATTPKKPQDNPSVHTLFAANENGTECFRHARKVPYQRKSGFQMQNIKVNGEELARALRKKIIPWMIETNSTVALLDDVPVNHCGPVKDAFEDNHIQLYPSAGSTHQVTNGYPPKSHDCSILDGFMFSHFQEDISRKILKLRPLADGSSKTVQLYNHIPIVWKSPKYIEMAPVAIKKIEKYLNKIILLQGRPTRL